MAKTVHDQRYELLPGTLDMFILRTLPWRPRHGQGIGENIRARSDDQLKVETGSLYPAPHRFGKRGWLRSESRVTGSLVATRCTRLAAS